MSEPLVKAENLVKTYDQRGGLLGRVRARVHAVNGVDLTIARGECVGLVGESGCGKSTLGKLLLRLLVANSGRIEFDGQDITRMSPAELRPLRRAMQMIFQDPYGSLNPRMTVERILGEALIFHGVVDPAGLSEHIDQLLDRVGLRGEVRRRLPHELSGGQRQRVGIARALSVEPRFILADEPVSALDVSIRAQILNLLQDLRDHLGLTLLVVSHDLDVVQSVCDRVAIMYLGFIVEELPCHHLERDVRHPYARALLAALPVADPRARAERPILQGDVPSPMERPRGCAFASRCPEVLDRCRDERPALVPIAPGHQVACHAITG